ncbi:MAG: hypothetical protein EZS28_006024 [Streblomastix strix]|uniref:Uncharacterized protein n=1 Tax=Streblomastix strix TaxID=222440 RepID=A0A5J4WU75_9EUKA|nr:MAG: hypothetical protein EZS28_006024 [Streblomastix strix]
MDESPIRIKHPRITKHQRWSDWIHQYTPQTYQLILEVVIDLIVFTAEQIIQSITESNDQEQLTNELERIVADGSDDNADEDQSENAIEPKHFINENNGLGRNDSGTQLLASVIGEVNLDIYVIKISVNTPLHNVNRTDEIGGNGCGTQQKAESNENGLINHQPIDNTGNENNSQQANDKRIGRQQQNNESQHEHKSKLQDNGNTKLKGIGSLHITRPQQELRNPNISQSQCQPSLIITLPELIYVKRKFLVPKQMIQPTNCHDSRDKTDQPKSILNKSLRSPEARANSDTINHFTPRQEQRKKVCVAPVTKDKSAKHSKGNMTSAGSKKYKQGSNSENQIVMVPDSEIDQPEQLY